jgi:hypothetical protein
MARLAEFANSAMSNPVCIMRPSLRRVESGGARLGQLFSGKRFGHIRNSGDVSCQRFRRRDTPRSDGRNSASPDTTSVSGCRSSRCRRIPACGKQLSGEVSSASAWPWMKPKSVAGLLDWGGLSGFRNRRGGSCYPRFPWSKLVAG